MADPLWIFGYGSLLWNPGFPVAERAVARLKGFHRSFCMRSIHHRGTPEGPGLVLALARAGGAACEGLALRAVPGSEDETLTSLRERELISSAYLERQLRLQLFDGRQVAAVTYVIDPDHVQFCRLSLEDQANIIAGAKGGRGPNAEYLYRTAAQLSELGIVDEDLGWLTRRVREISAGTRP